jgi:hypothetical protein
MVKTKGGTDAMNKVLIYTLLGVVAAIVISWFLIDTLFGVVTFFVKIVIVSVIALVAYFALRRAFTWGARK